MAPHLKGALKYGNSFPPYLILKFTIQLHTTKFTTIQVLGFKYYYNTIYTI